MLNFPIADNAGIMVHRSYGGYQNKCRVQSGKCIRLVSSIISTRYLSLMISKADAIQLYIQAKDSNRPFLLNGAFAEGITLKIDVPTEAISFPSSLFGRDAIADTLVRQFNQEYENIYTICIGNKPDIEGVDFSCYWLVVMTEKQSGTLRVGCGEYEWNFNATSNTVQSLSIAIDTMETAPSASVTDAMAWVSDLPYPWAELSVVAREAPDVSAITRVMQHLVKLHKSC